MDPLVPAIQTYLADVLGAPPARATPWPGKGLPFFLLDSFSLVHLPLFGSTVTLAIDKAPGTLAPAEIASRLQLIRAKAGLALYAAPTLGSDDRRRLIGHKVSFIVPGNQLYLPDLGIDLREHFRRQAEDASTARLSPSTQALLIRHLLDLLHHNAASTDWQVAATTRALGYTAMTGSRAANEVGQLGLGRAERRNRSVHIVFEGQSERALWEAMKPHVRSPVARTKWLPELPTDLKRHARTAGIAALAAHTLLQGPEHRVLAVDRDHWLASPRRPELKRPEPGAVEVQVWNYSPALIEGQAEVDPLSLIASLRDDPDERVQAALKDLEGALPW